MYRRTVVFLMLTVAMATGCHPGRPRGNGRSPSPAKSASAREGDEVGILCLLGDRRMIRGQEIMQEYEGTYYSLCSERCRRRFLANPGMYLDLPAKRAP